MYELSVIFDVDLEKIDFLISPEAYVHSVILNKDNTVNINCFENDMLITLIKPLQFFYPDLHLKYNEKFMFPRKMKLEKFNDRDLKLQNI